MAFTNEQLERYSRHIILKEIGVKGQKKLLNAKVLIIGAGGLGAPVAMYLQLLVLVRLALPMQMKWICPTCSGKSSMQPRTLESRR